MKKIKDRVLIILEKYPPCRNDDKQLFIQYCREYHPRSVIYSEKMDRFYLDIEQYFSVLPSTETIRRSRQLVQAEGKYPPTSERVAKQRDLNEQRIRAYCLDHALEMAHP